MPQWWFTGDGSYFVGYDMAEGDKENRFRDPRWAGAFKKTFGSGTTTEVDFRTLSFNVTQSNAGNHLYLSWHIKVHPNPATGYTGCYIDVGLRPSSGVPHRFLITIPNTLTQTTNDGSGAFTTAVFTHNGTAWAPSAAAVPGWLTGNTRVWLQGSAPKWWAVHMRIPATAGAAGGLDLSGLFGLGFHVESNISVASVSYSFPPALNVIPDFSNPANYETCFLQVAAPIAGVTALQTGVSLPQANIGTTGITVTVKNSMGNPVVVTGVQYINYKQGSTTPFFAKPVNGVVAPTVNANKLQATFLLANWGSGTTASDHWKSIGDTSTHAPILAGATGQLTMNWTPDAAQAAFYAATPHQCMLVRLATSDPNIVFLNDSAARNMDFGYASKFAREAEINVTGIADGFAQPKRDVYIYVERSGMPSVIDGLTRENYIRVQETFRALTNVEGDWSSEERYIAILRGDLRHLRFIAMDDATEWVQARISEGELTMNPLAFQALRLLGIGADSLSGLIERYEDPANRFFRSLEYDNNGQPILQPIARQIIDILLSNITYTGSTPAAHHPLPPLEELQTFLPAVRYYVYHDTGRRTTIEGVVRPVLESQHSFGYYMWFDHDVTSWELRLQGAEKVGEDLYLLRPPTNGSANVTTVIHAVQEGEQIDPPERIVPLPKYTLDGPPVDPGPIEIPTLPPGCIAILQSLLRLIQALFKPLNRP